MLVILTMAMTLSVYCLKNNNLHFEIQIDKNHPVGQTDAAGIKDILIESAVTHYSRL